MCSEARRVSPTSTLPPAIPSLSRPKIELVRVSSSERAKIPVNPVQLSLVYHHVRSATFVPLGNNNNHNNNNNNNNNPNKKSPLLSPSDALYPPPLPCSPLPPPPPPPPLPHHYYPPPTLVMGALEVTPSRPRPCVVSGSKSCEELHRVSVKGLPPPPPPPPPPASSSEGCLVTLLLTPKQAASPGSGCKYRVWRGFSRSVRDMSITRAAPPRPAISLATMDRLLPRPPPHHQHQQQHHHNKASTLPYSAASGPRPAARRHRGLMALLRRLSPRLRRSPSPDPPWVQVEPRPPHRTSIASDHSFDAALNSRYPDLATHNNAHTPTAVVAGGGGGGGGGGKGGGESGRTSKSGGLSGLLSSFRPNKSRSQQTTTSTSTSPRPNGHTPHQ
ncbi:hypothetical protein Pmani_029725, partial [Petrolisthes manimaculis]